MAISLSGWSYAFAAGPFQAGSGRYLDATPSPHAYPWIVGKRWPPGTGVQISVRYHAARGHVSLVTRRDGTFGVALQGVRWCHGLVIQAVDATGYRVVLHGAHPFLPCPVATEGPAIVLHVLTASDLRVREFFVDGRHPSTSRTVRLGDMVSVYVRQAYPPVAAIDVRHFRVIESGPIPPCPAGADCMVLAGAYYRVVTIRAGDASLPAGSGRSVKVTILPPGRSQ